MNALAPVMTPVVLAVLLNVSVIGLPSEFVPVITKPESSMCPVVPPTVTVSARGTSGLGLMTIVCGDVVEAVEANKAVAEPAATVFLELV